MAVLHARAARVPGKFHDCPVSMESIRTPAPPSWVAPWLSRPTTTDGPTSPKDAMTSSAASMTPACAHCSASATTQAGSPSSPDGDLPSRRAKPAAGCSATATARRTTHSVRTQTIRPLHHERRNQADLARARSTGLTTLRDSVLPGRATAKSTSIGRLLAHHGARIAASPESFLVEGLTGALVEGELERARAWGQRLARRDCLPGVAGAPPGLLTPFAVTSATVREHRGTVNGPGGCSRRS